jgi:hypothetical protein
MSILKTSTDVGYSNSGLLILCKTLEIYGSSSIKLKEEQIDQQNKLIELNVIEIIGYILCSSKDFQILNTSLSLLGRLLEGPNRHCQSSVITYFMDSDRGVLFSTLEKLISNSLDGIVDVVEQQNQHNLNSNLRGIDNKQVIDRIEANMKMENFDLKMDFITLFFNVFIALMRNNDNGRAFMRRPMILEHGKQSFKVTLIVFSAQILGKVLKCPHDRCLMLADIILEFLLECIIGPSPENQEEVMKTNFIDCVKDLLNEYSEGGVDLEPTSLSEKNAVLLRRLCTKSIIVIKYLLEGNRRYQENRQKIIQLIRPHFLVTKIKDDLFTYASEKLDKEERDKFTLSNLKKIYDSQAMIDETLTSIFEQFFVLKMILPDSSSEQELLGRLTPDEDLTYKFLEKYSGTIEVIFENSLHKVNLEIQPLFQYMDDEEMHIIENSVRRDTAKNKINDFIALMPTIFDLISYKASLKNTRIFFSAKTFKFVGMLNFILVLILNVLIIIFFEKRLYFGSTITDPSFDETHVSISIVINLHMVTLILRLIIFFFFQCRISLMGEWRRIFERVHEKLRQADSTANRELITLAQKRFVDLTMKERFLLFETYNKLEGRAVNYPPLDFLVKCTIMITRMPNFRLIALYTLITVFAYTQNIFFFYSLLLLDALVASPHPEPDRALAEHRQEHHAEHRPVRHDRLVRLADHLPVRLLGLRVLPRRFLPAKCGGRLP